MDKYFTYVVIAADEKAARSLVPGELINGNKVVAVSLGDAMAVKDKFKELIPDDKQDESDAIEMKDLEPFQK